MQKKEPVGDEDSVPEEAQSLESLTADTLSVWLIPAYVSAFLHVIKQIGIKPNIT